MTQYLQNSVYIETDLEPQVSVWLMKGKIRSIPEYFLGSVLIIFASRYNLVQGSQTGLYGYISPCICQNL